jgi:cytochrome b561
MDKFSLPARWLHWSIAGLLLIQIPLAWYMVDLPLGMDKLEKYSWHKSLGMLLFALGVMRLVRGLVGSRPPLPAETPRYEKILAKVLQALLYLIILVMPISGWLMSSAANVPVKLFSLVTLPPLIEPDKALVEVFEEVHELQSFLLLTLVTLHILAALKHQLINRDNVLHSMLPLVRKR